MKVLFGDRNFVLETGVMFGPISVRKPREKSNNGAQASSPDSSTRREGGKVTIAKIDKINISYL